MLAVQESKGSGERDSKKKKFTTFCVSLKTLANLLFQRCFTSCRTRDRTTQRPWVPVWGRLAWTAPNLWIIAAQRWFNIKLANGGAYAATATCAAYQINDLPGWNWLRTRIQRKSRWLKFNQHQEPLQQESHFRIDLPIWGVCRNTDEQVHLGACEEINRILYMGERWGKGGVTHQVIYQLCLKTLSAASRRTLV